MHVQVHKAAFFIVTLCRWYKKVQINLKTVGQKRSTPLSLPETQNHETLRKERIGGCRTPVPQNQNRLSGRVGEHGTVSPHA